MLNILSHLSEAATGVMLSVGGWILVFPLRSLIKSVKAEWAEKMKTLDYIQVELTTQRTNCLKTLQDQGTEQIKLLGKAVDTLDKIHVSQAEMSGYLRAKE